MKKLHSYSVPAILTLAVALLFGIANTACYGDLEFHMSETPYDEDIDDGTGWSHNGHWDGGDSYAYAYVWDGPTWSSASASVGTGTCGIVRWTTGGTGTEVLYFEWSVNVEGEIGGNAINDDPEVTGYGWAGAWADGDIELDAYGSSDDYSDSFSVSLWEETTEPGLIEDDDSDGDSGNGYCYADATLIVVHESSAAAYFDNDASWMEGEARGEVNSTLD